MGIIPSRYDAPYKYFPEIFQHKEVFNKLQLKDAEIGKIYKCFKSIDTDGSKRVTLNEIFFRLRMEKTLFNKRIFSILDTDGSGDLNFGEFLVGLWSFCSIENKNFEHFAFDLYDTDNSGVIDVSEAQFMLKDIYGEDFDRSPRARKVHQKLDDLGMTEIDFPAFRDFTHKHKAMLYPAFALQLSLKKYIMGKAFWKQQAKNREKICGGKYKTIQAIIGEELFEKQKGGKSIRRNSGRRGSKSHSFDAPAMPESSSRRRGSRDSLMDEAIAPGSRRGSVELDVDMGLLGGPLDVVSIRSRRGSRDYDSSREVVLSRRRKSKDHSLRCACSRLHSTNSSFLLLK
mmetsp:Transcript_479/g.1123  ORF Transcript_479/g.1123 Transcript_479/m.1123 type:complete len:343 (-) Transcript_479:904-1932(-)